MILPQICIYVHVSITIYWFCFCFAHAHYQLIQCCSYCFQLPYVHPFYLVDEITIGVGWL